ncbi:MAG: glycosyl hydrolase family 18 [Lachnospiraceae bacterium]|nr:glycosyl hydrolase family 18 [Lachnospiraceae bacterium]MBQ4069379.1 glycosyl hydrolase family 18 [Lachnospiraceae bacterium]
MSTDKMKVAVNKQKVIATLIGIGIIIIATVAFIIEENIRRNTPSKKHISENEIEEMFGVDGENMVVVFNDIIDDAKGYVFDEKIYLEYEFVKKNINSRFYWDNNENILIYTTPTEIIKSDVGAKEYYVNKSKNVTDYAIVKTKGDKVYVAIEYVKLYSDMLYEVMEEPDRICITSGNGQEYEAVYAKKSGQVRTGTHIKKSVVRDVTSDDRLVLLPNDEEQDEEWFKVSTNGGYVGYIKKSQVGDVKTEVIETGYEEPVYTNIKKDFTICMGWHMVTTEGANSTIYDATAVTKGMNVISPTWFRISDNDGNISSIADSTYVQRAHQMGMEVWAMVDDQSPDSSDDKVFTYTSKRENLENALLSEAIEHGIDGINVDFEYITEDIAEDYIQFIREFSVKCRNNGIVLSIDNYVSASYNKFYNREEQGKVADYVIIMGYDEHTKGSKEAGSVASLSWVKEGIENTLLEVPSEKVINAVPFYTRIWEEKDGKLVGTRALGLVDAMDEMEANGAELVWIDVLGQYYGEYTVGGTLCRSWLEDPRSIEEKAKLIGEYNLAGIAAWRLGYEDADVWNTIIKYTN